MLEAGIAAAAEHIASGIAVSKREYTDLSTYENGKYSKNNSRSQLAEDAAAANFAHTVGVGITHVALHALVLRVAVGADVALEERNAGDGRIAHRVTFAQGAGRERAV